MPQYNAILFQFIRRRAGGIPEPSSHLDDTLRIQKLGENNLRVTYTERTEDGVICDTTLMTYQRLFHYVWRMFWLLTVDVDPFLQVQLTIPGYPMVLIPVTMLNQNMVTIMDILMTTCWQWPRAIVVEEARRHRVERAVMTANTPTPGPPPLDEEDEVEV